MRSSRLTMAVVSLLACVALPRIGAAQTFGGVEESEQGTQELVVDFQDRASETEIRNLASGLGIQLRANSERMVSEDRIYTFRVPASQVESTLSHLRDSSLVQGAEPNRIMRATWTPNDPLLSNQWGMQRVGAETAWNYTCGRNVRVAVIDTGVACETHGRFTRLSDLAQTECAPGWNFVGDNEHANDDQGHGSHVAGTIAQSTNNALGGAGVAHCATIIPVKVLDSRGSGTLADVAEGIRFAADAGAHVINLSLGGGPRNKVMEEAVRYARSRGTVVICAAGNNGYRVESPANEPGAFAVSALGPGDMIASFSSRGPEIAIGAPGVNILQQTICENGRNGCEQFASWSGTSMATPHVAGIAALIISMGVSDVDAVESTLRNSALVPEHGNREQELYGSGVASAESAVKYVQRKQLIYRGVSLGILLLALYKYLQTKGGKLESAIKWAIPAAFAAFGLFFLPWVIPQTVPGISVLMRAPGDWTSLTNPFIHQFLPLGSAFLPIVVAATLYGKKSLRPVIGGFSLGTAAFLLGTFLTGFHSAPLGWLGMFFWTITNVFVMGVLARLTLDVTQNKT